MPFTTLKIAVVAPIAIASVRTVATVNAGVLARARNVWRRFIAIPLRAEQPGAAAFVLKQAAYQPPRPSRLAPTAIDHRS
jgi:hypothetical protein